MIEVSRIKKRKIKKDRTKETFWIRCNVSDGRSRIPYFTREFIVYEFTFQVADRIE